MNHTPDPSYGQPGLETSSTAGLWPRAGARLIDFVLLAVVNALIIGVLVVGSLVGRASGMFVGTGTSIVGALVGAAVNLAYFTAMEWRFGQTVGKMVLQLRTIGPRGGTPTIEQALRRNVWVAFGAAGVIPIVGGLLGSVAQLVAVVLIAVGINDAKGGGRGWHDRFAGGTSVVPKQEHDFSQHPSNRG